MHGSCAGGHFPPEPLQGWHVKRITATAPRRRSQGKQADVRRVAEVHFKVGLALQFLQNPAKALHHTQVHLSKRDVRQGLLPPPPVKRCQQCQVIAISRSVSFCLNADLGLTGGLSSPQQTATPCATRSRCSICLATTC